MQKRKRCTGLSVIELLVSLALTGVVLVPASALLLQAYANEATYRQQNGAQTGARAALDTLSDDIRGLAYITDPVTKVRTTSLVIPANITQATPLRFYVYGPNMALVGTDPLYMTNQQCMERCPAIEKHVRYWMNGNALMRQLDDNLTRVNAIGGQAVAQNLGAFPSLTVTTYSDKTEKADISVTATTGQSSVTQNSMVVLRNSKLR